MSADLPAFGSLLPPQHVAGDPNVVVDVLLSKLKNEIIDIYHHSNQKLFCRNSQIMAVQWEKAPMQIVEGDEVSSVCT